MYEGPEFRHLVSFVAIAEECSFTRAAERLHIAQPALTNHIKQLEDGLGAILFRRVPVGAELTEPGRRFLPVARQMLHMRMHAVRAASRAGAEVEWPLRLGYSPYMNHDVLTEALKAYAEIVPDGRFLSSSDCTAELLAMLHDGRLDAAIVTLPATAPELSKHPISEHSLLICLRKDDPCASLTAIPKEVVAERLSIMFTRHSHPELHDYIMRKFNRAGMSIEPVDTFSAPAEMQFMVKTRGCFGLIREGVPLDVALTTRPMEGFTLRIGTALLCRKELQRPVLPLLAYRMAQASGHEADLNIPKKPVRRLWENDSGALRKQG